jgi:uncharacterized protein (UPF0276 family)
MNAGRLSAASAGLGLRRALLHETRSADPHAFDFLECAPENWINVGGRLGDAFAEVAARTPIACHGLSLSLGGYAPLDPRFLGQLRGFLDTHRVALYSDHLSYCGDAGYLYDLLPIPFTEAAVRHVAARIRAVQDALGRRIAVENVSYYAAPFQALSELQFVNAVLSEADCDLLLDVNNVFVNSTNFGYDARAFINALPAERVVALHIAGHYDEAPDLKIDTHGAAVADDVWSLLDHTYARMGLRPTLLERDFNFPPFSELLQEVARIRAAQRRHAAISSGATTEFIT